jgi:hypothetical protein
MSKESQNGSRNGRTVAGTLFTPRGPRLVTDTATGEVARLVFHEDKRERRALAILAKRLQEQIERVNEICSDDGARKAGFRLHVSRADLADQEALRRPWRPGTRRQRIVLWGDRVPALGGVHSLMGGFSETPTVENVIAHLRKTADECRAMAERLEADVAANPELWEPLPTLGEFMDAATAGKVGAP